MNNIQKIMFGKLRPWLENNNLPSEYYKPLTRGLNTIQATFNPHYELNFIRHFSDKTQYYKKLIDSDLITYCNQLFEETENASSNLIAFRIDKSKKELHSRIKAIAEIANTQNLELPQIVSQNADFSIDRQSKESTFVVFYLLSALIKCCLEIQHHFREVIHEDNLMEISDYYTQLLQRHAPVNSFIKEILTLKIESTPEEKKKETDTSGVLAFTYKKLNTHSDDIANLFNSLKKSNRIAQDTSITDFKHAFSGVVVENPIRWTGAKSELPYLIKMLCNTHKVLEYTGSIWQIVCACFVDKDGNSFEETNLKDQKKPKQTANDIEKIANLMK